MDIGSVSESAPRINLSSSEDIRREMARVYRDMRCQVVKTQDGSRLIYALGEIRKIFETVSLEERIFKLETSNENY